ncbi:MAG: MotA/TolQ/ExbB proton channel family protein [Vannielia sp.]|uniref:MotA/TolQ/ExbB proton channel family protein n=1 Tax=Rhodobacterales TaxID=204455 RepID=UPI0020952B95|nr:MotA/TolQ/ExbB proton channel family protein [Oceanicola sp. 502str15]MCO6382632.1 MotA/TolQ/ExbB proton channel family protein [Oceanicola sp. 502str15]
MDAYLPEGLSGYAWAILAVLAGASLVALTVALFKIFQFMRLGVGRRRMPTQIVEKFLKGDGDGALALADKRNTSAVRVLFAALSALRSNPGDRDFARELSTQVALDELALMARRMNALEAVVQAAPMLGLLGTVVGMIEAFGKLAKAEGAVDPSVLAGGIWTALITTAVGLAIAIFFYFISLWLEGRIAREREALERLISTVLHGRVETRPGKTII